MWLLKTALLALRFRWRAHIFLALGLALGFALILLLSGLAGGMKRNLTEAAARHYGGNLFVLGHQQAPYYTPLVRDHDALLAAVKAAGIEPRLIVRRTNFFENGQVFFNGYSARQKIVTGIDWQAEGNVFEGMEFTSGGTAGMKGSNGILLSSVTARQLGTRLGDDVILEVDTVSGQRNTATLVVRGIFKDASIFGAYASYLDIGLLGGLMGLGPGEYTTFGIYLDDPASATRLSPRLYAALAKTVPLFSPVRTQQELWERLGERWTGIKYAVLTLDGYLSELKDVSAAVDAGLYLLLILMLAIITLGIGNTYRVMVHERVREFGMLRAIGMRREAVVLLVLSEALLMAVASVAAGTLIGFSLLAVIGNLKISRIPGFDIFLRKGSIGWQVSAGAYALDALLAIAAVLLGGLVPARRASRVEPARALRRNA